MSDPRVSQSGAAGNEHYEWQSKQQHPQGPHPLRVPHDEPLSRVRRFIWKRIKVADEKGGHEDRGRGDEREFYGGNDAFPHEELYTAKYTQVSRGRLLAESGELAAVASAFTGHLREIAVLPTSGATGSRTQNSNPPSPGINLCS